MSNFCDFIQVYVFTTNHHLKVYGGMELRVYPVIVYCLGKRITAQSILMSGWLLNFSGRICN